MQIQLFEELLAAGFQVEAALVAASEGVGLEVYDEPYEEDEE